MLRYDADFKKRRYFNSDIPETPVGVQICFAKTAMFDEISSAFATWVYVISITLVQHIKSIRQFVVKMFYNLGCDISLKSFLYCLIFMYDMVNLTNM